MDEHRALSTVHPDVARERSSVDLADPGHVPLPQVLVERRFARVVARYRTRPAHRERAGPRPRGLGVRVTHPVVALQRIGHTHHLACIRRVRKDRKSTRLNSSHLVISYAVFCLKKKKTT